MQIPHARLVTESTTLITPSKLAARQRTWKILRRESAPLLWLPRLCDVAMNHIPHADSVAEICDSPEFARLSGAHPHPYADLTVTPALARSAMSDPARPLFRRYIRSQLSRLATHLTFRHRQERHDAEEMLEEKFLALLGKYEVGGLNKEGALVSWGFEAFLSERLVWSVGSRLRTRAHRAHDDIDGDAGRVLTDEFSDPSRCAERSAIREVVRRVLTEQIDTSLAVETYRALVYSNNSYEEIAAKLGCSTGSIGHRVSGPLIAKLQQVLREAGFVGRGKVSWRRLREPLAQAVSEREFDALMSQRLPLPVAVPKSETSLDDRPHMER